MGIEVCAFFYRYVVRDFLGRVDENRAENSVLRVGSKRLIDDLCI